MKLENQDYMEVAELASRYERSQDWELAAERWSDAMSLANCLMNVYWAKRRFDFCVRWGKVKGEKYGDYY